MPIWILSVLLGVSFTVLVLYAIFTIAQRQAKNEAFVPSRGPVPFVSILKPLRAADDDLERNLESYYHLDYPRYEILFALDQEDDPCARMVRRLKAQYPGIPTSILVTGNSHTENPKIHKLTRLAPLSRGELFWVTDSNIRVKPGTLDQLVATHLAKDAKIVFSPIRGTSSRTLGSLMDSMGLNFFTSGSVMSAWALFRLPIIVGKSMLIERAALASFGGFAYFKNYLAEDFLLGEAFLKSGYAVDTDYTWVTNVNQTMSVRGFVDRMSRWAKLRFHLKRSAYFLEILLNPIAVAAAGALGVGRRGGLLVAGAAALKIALEYANFLAVNLEDRRKPWAHMLFPAAVILKDLLLLGIYFTPFFSRSVRWRKEKIGIGKMTLIALPQNMDNLVHEGA
jgi:ceramide glucosyltransferase